MEQLVYSSSPHIKSGRTTKKIMIDVCIALVPACIMGCVFFGWNALLTLAIAVISAVVCEFVYRLCCKVSFKQIVQEFDFTSLVTGILVGMNMPANIDWYVPMLASFFAIAVVKMLFGGTGKNFVNPAIAGRIFVFISFSAMLKPAQALIGSISGDVVSTGATALQNIFKPGTVSGLTNLDLFLGTGVAGVLGETCKVALLLGGVYLVIRKVIDFKWPLIYIAVTGLFTVCLNGFNFEVFLPSILSGGLILGAIFMATDYVTSPNTLVGNIIYFTLLGLLTAGLRQLKHQEVVSYVILFGNLLVPLIDKYIVNKPFGEHKKVKEATK